MKILSPVYLLMLIFCFVGMSFLAIPFCMRKKIMPPLTRRGGRHMRRAHE